MVTETNQYTVKLTTGQMAIVAKITHAMTVDKIARWDDLETEQQLDLVEVRNLTQKQLDFPDLKF